MEYLETYATGAPVQERTTVHGVRRDRRGHLVTTDAGDWHARNVVVATGDCDQPRIPPIATAAPPFLHQLHATGYRRPGRLPEGGVLVVGAGPSGQQIAAELRRAGRDVVLERGRVGERWRSERWESLRLLTPNWLNRLPGAPALPDPHGYLDRRGVVEYLERYATGAPVPGVVEATTLPRVPLNWSADVASTRLPFCSTVAM